MSEARQNASYLALFAVWRWRRSVRVGWVITLASICYFFSALPATHIMFKMGFTPRATPTFFKSVYMAFEPVWWLEENSEVVAEILDDQRELFWGYRVRWIREREQLGRGD